MNLTTLANARAWLSLTTDTNNALVQRLIAEGSRTLLNYMQRPDIGITTITEVISGKSTPKITLRNWPVVAVNSLTIDGVVIPASSGPTNYGFAVEQYYGSSAGSPQMLGIIGTVQNGTAWPSPYGYYGQSPPVVGQSYGRPFSSGVNNISVNYSYGYTVQGEAQTVPGTPYQVTPAQTYGTFIQDLGVTYANGVPLIATTGTPAIGHYVPPSILGDSPAGYYQFAAADAAASVLISYNYVPYDLEQACVEMVGERYRYAGRIGEASRSMGGQETASYMVKDALTASIKARVNPYRMVWAS